MLNVLQFKSRTPVGFYLRVYESQIGGDTVNVGLTQPACQLSISLQIKIHRVKLTMQYDTLSTD